MKIVFNNCHGGFGLSEEAATLYRQYAMVEKDDYSEYDIPRNDQYLVKVVERLGKAADGRFARLKIVDIPDDVEWHIGEYDGIEWVAENHRTWN